MNWERDTLSEPFPVDQINRILVPWLNGRRVVDAELLSGGLMNRNYCLQVAGTPEVCVLRLFDRDPLACGREIAVLQLLRGRVPVPEVLYVQPDATDTAPPHAVLSFAPGISLFDLRERGDAEALGEACYDTGRVLARLAAYRFPKAGVLTRTLGVDSACLRGPVTNAALVEELTEEPVFRERVGDAWAERIRAFARDHEPRICALASGPSLVHGDFNSRNVFVHRTTQGWRVAAVLDWEFALAASPYIDIGNFLRYHQPTRRRYEPHFSRGLVDGGMELPADWLTVARLLDLPACCELIGRARTPQPVVDEMRDLIGEVVTTG